MVCSKCISTEDHKGHEVCFIHIADLRDGEAPAEPLSQIISNVDSGSAGASPHRIVWMTENQSALISQVSEGIAFCCRRFLKTFFVIFVVLPFEKFFNRRSQRTRSLLFYMVDLRDGEAPAEPLSQIISNVDSGSAGASPSRIVWIVHSHCIDGGEQRVAKRSRVSDGGFMAVLFDEFNAAWKQRRESLEIDLTTGGFRSLIQCDVQNIIAV